MDAAKFRSRFPVLEKRAYLNTGSDGPIPRRSVEAAREQLESELVEGRSGSAHAIALGQMAEDLRRRLASLLGADVDQVALTGSTTDGVNAVLNGFPFDRGDEVLTTDEEHPGLLAPLGALRKRRGVDIRTAPFDDVANAVSSRTRLIAVSHVSWLRGALVAIDDLRSTGVPLLLDGAQALGAIPVDVDALGCDFYAAAGQKWLCGPDRTGVLYVKRERVDELGVPWPGFMTLAEVTRPLELVPAPGARRFDSGMIASTLVAGSLGSLDVLAEAGWPWIFERGPRLAGLLRERLTAEGVEVLTGVTTLVSWRPRGVSDMEGAVAVVQKLEERDVVVRAFPGKPWIRASVGAWNSEDDLDRLLAEGV